ncbi:MAG: hypothetical protein P4M08_01455 [Oligoflexia bacterium]|nr:hypothetical protein [Oligoflexia bacterium]
MKLIEVFFNRDVFILVPAAFFIIFAVTEIFFRIGRLIRSKAIPEQEIMLEFMPGALISMLALLLAFTVSMAEARYDSRQKIAINETNAIGTAYLRAGLLECPARSEIDKLLRKYVDLRLEFYRMNSKPSLQSLQSDIWRLAAESGRKHPGDVTIGLFLNSLNEMIDQAETQSAAFENQIPAIIIALLFASSILVMAAVGYASGLEKGRRLLFTSILSIIIAMTLFVILDLDRPRRGTVHPSQEGMNRLKMSMLGASAPCP